MSPTGTDQDSTRRYRHVYILFIETLLHRKAAFVKKLKGGSHPKRKYRNRNLCAFADDVPNPSYHRKS